MIYNRKYMKWFPKKKKKKKSSDYRRQHSAFLSTKNILCVYYLNVTLLYFFKIIYITIEGQEGIRERKEQKKKKRREQSVYK